MGLNSPCVQKLLHCFSDTSNRVRLGLILFQKLRKSWTESLCLAWDRQSAAHGGCQAACTVPGLFHPSPNPYLTTLFLQNTVGIRAKCRWWSRLFGFLTLSGDLTLPVESTIKPLVSLCLFHDSLTWLAWHDHRFRGGCTLIPSPLNSRS